MLRLCAKNIYIAPSEVTPAALTAGLSNVNLRNVSRNWNIKRILNETEAHGYCGVIDWSATIALMLKRSTPLIRSVFDCLCKLNHRRKKVCWLKEISYVRRDVNKFEYFVETGGWPSAYLNHLQ